MRTSEAYDRYIINAEKNSTTDGLSTDKQRFIELYNQAQIRVLEYFYDKKADDDIRYIAPLLVTDLKLDDFLKKRDFYSFRLPSDYFDLSSAYAIGSKGSCTSKRIDLIREIDDFNRPYFLADEFTSPSFEYRETIFNIGGNNINVFYKDFDVDKVYLTYYRYPKPLRLQNPDNPESDFDDSFELDFDDRVINRIISATVSNFDYNTSNERWQIGQLFAKTPL